MGAEESSLPTIGGEYVYKGQNVRVTAVKKRGRGYQVHYAQWAEAGAQTRVARLRDWQRGTQ